MKGWKTWFGAIALAFTAIGIIGDCMASGDWTKLEQALTLFGQAAVAVGIGHKVEKSGGV